MLCFEHDDLYFDQIHCLSVLIQTQSESYNLSVQFVFAQNCLSLVIDLRYYLRY